MNPLFGNKEDFDFDLCSLSFFFPGYQMPVDKVLEDDAPFDIVSCQVSDSFNVAVDKFNVV